jgi:lipoprotein-anchoring transpeptidase ErfK/SrfK
MNWRLVVPAVAAALLWAGFAVPSQAQIDPLTGRPLENVGVYSYTPIPPQVVNFQSDYAPGTIVVKTAERRLYLVEEDGKARRYAIGVGRDGFTFSGSFALTRKAEWPSWTPTPAMHARMPGLPAFMPGGPGNPMGARALYIGSTLYRIHGTTDNWSINRNYSSGCIRLTNEDVIDLYERVRVGARIVVYQ